MKPKQQTASVVAALVIGAGAALALTSASVAMWLAAGAAVGIVLGAVLNNLVSDAPAKEQTADHEELGARS